MTWFLREGSRDRRQYLGCDNFCFDDNQTHNTKIMMFSDAEMRSEMKRKADALRWGDYSAVTRRPEEVNRRSGDLRRQLDDATWLERFDDEMQRQRDEYERLLSDDTATNVRCCIFSAENMTDIFRSPQHHHDPSKTPFSLSYHRNFATRYMATC